MAVFVESSRTQLWDFWKGGGLDVVDHFVQNLVVHFSVYGSPGVLIFGLDFVPHVFCEGVAAVAIVLVVIGSGELPQERSAGSTSTSTDSWWRTGRASTTSLYY